MQTLSETAPLSGQEFVKAEELFTGSFDHGGRSRELCRSRQPASPLTPLAVNVHSKFGAFFSVRLRVQISLRCARSVILVHAFLHDCLSALIHPSPVEPGVAQYSLTLVMHVTMLL